MKTMKYYHNLYLKCGVLLLADVLEKFGNNSLKIMDMSKSLFKRTSLKVGLSPPKKIFLKRFLFHLKSSFRSQDI